MLSRRVLLGNWCDASNQTNEGAGEKGDGMSATKHILLAVLEDKPGVLNRMASVFRRRGFNIESVNVIDTISVEEEGLPNLTRVTIVLSGPRATVDELKRQLDKIVDVVKVSEVSSQL